MDEEGVTQRFGNSDDEKVHWDGGSVQNRGIKPPPEVERRFAEMKKDCIYGIKKNG